MYTEQFGLAEDPFKISPSLRFVHRSGGFESALQMLRSGLFAGRPLSLVAAESGLGKTALLKLLAAELLGHEPRYALALQGCGSWTNAPALLDALGEARPAALLLDEAQNLTRAALRELLALALAPQTSVQIVFAASPAFAARLEGRDVLLTQLRPLDRAEVSEYVRERLAAAGRADPDAFAPEALALVAAASEGVPRLVNRICSTSIFLAATAGERRVSAARVNEAANTLGLVVPAQTIEEPAPEVVEPAAEPLSVRAAAETPAAKSAPTLNTDSESPPFEPERPSVQPNIPAPDLTWRAAPRAAAPILMAEPRPSLRPTRRRSRVPGGFPGIAAAAAAGSAMALLTLVAAPQLLPPLPQTELPILAELARLQEPRQGVAAPEPRAAPSRAEATAAVAPEAAAPQPEPPRVERTPLPPPNAPVSAQGAPVPETRAAANEPAAARIEPERVASGDRSETATAALRRPEPDMSAPPAAVPQPAGSPDSQVAERPAADVPPPRAGLAALRRAAEDASVASQPEAPPERRLAGDPSAQAAPSAPERKNAAAERSPVGPPAGAFAALRRAAEDASLASLPEKARELRLAGDPAQRAAEPDAEQKVAAVDAPAEARQPAPSGAMAAAEPGGAPPKDAAQSGPTDQRSGPEPLADVVLKALRRSAGTGTAGPQAAQKPEASARVAAVDPTSPARATSQVPPDPVAQKLELARRQVAAGRHTAPSGDNAFETYRSVLALAPGNDDARRGLDELAARETKLAEEAEIRGDWIGAVEHFETALAIAPDHPDVHALAEARRQAAASVAPSPKPETPAAAPADGAPRPLLAVAPPVATRAPLAAPARPLRPEPVRPLARDLLDSAERVEAALRRGADPDSRYEGLHRPLTVAVQQRRPDIVAILLRHGADPNARTRDGATPLMYAAWQGDLVSGTFLLEAGAQTGLQNADGKTALMAAAMRGHTAFVELLLRNGASPDAQNVHGWTALMYAAWGGHEQAVARLLRAGANPAIENDAGQSAAQLAESRQRLAVARLIAAAPTAAN